MYRSFALFLATAITSLAFPAFINAQKPPADEIVGRNNKLKKAAAVENKTSRLTKGGLLTEREAIKLKNPWALNDIGVDLVAKGNFDDAARVLNEAIDFAPKMAGLHVNLSTVYERMGRLDDALRHAQTGADLEPTKPRPYRQLCGVLFQLNRFGAASDCYHDLVKLTPDAESRTLLATALVNAGQNDKAIEILGEVTKQTPLHARAHNSMGVARFNKKKYAAAARSFKRAVEINPSSSLFRFNLGVSHALNHNKAGALSQYRELQKLDPERARKIYKLIYRDKVVFVGKENTPK